MKNRFVKMLLIGTVLIGGSMYSTEVFAINTNDMAKINNDKVVMLLAKNDSIEDGRYNVEVQILKEKSEELSMAGQYVDGNAVIDVEGGNMYLTIKISRNDWMEDIKVSVNDSEVKYETVQQDNEGKVATLRFEIPNKNANVKFKMNVVPMGNVDVTFRIALNDDIQKISNGNLNKDTKKSGNAKGTSSTNNEKELPETGYPTSGGSLLVMGGLSTILGVGLLKRRK